MAIKVKVNQLDYGYKVVFGIFKEDGQDVFIWLGGKWEKFEPGVVDQKVSLEIPGSYKEEVLQQLADILYAMGFKPGSLKAALSELERVESHLLDAIAVRDRLLALIEGKQ